MYGYFAYKDLLKFSKNIVKTIIKFSNYIPTSKYEIFTGYLEHLEKNGYNFEEEKLEIIQGKTQWHKLKTDGTRFMEKTYM